VAYDDAKVEYTTQKTKFDAAKTRFDNADASLERLGRTQVAIEELALQAAQHAGLTGTTIDDIEDEVKALELVVQGGTANAEQMKQYEKFYEVFDGRDKVIGFMRNAETTNASMHNVNLLTHASAADSLRSIRDALNEISNMRGTIGAGMNRLLAGISVMQTQARNTLSAESSIRDANMAEEITSMTKYQILAQTGIAALAHSNANSQTVLRLLQ
jgi:flagellin-like hook-associated protein FlgL